MIQQFLSSLSDYFLPFCKTQFIIIAELLPLFTNRLTIGEVTLLVLLEQQMTIENLI